MLFFADLQCNQSTVSLTFYNRKEIRCQGSLNPIVLTTDDVESILDNKKGKYKILEKSIIVTKFNIFTNCKSCYQKQISFCL